jgi:hypothetical protein
MPDNYEMDDNQRIEQSVNGLLGRLSALLWENESLKAEGAYYKQKYIEAMKELAQLKEKGDN